MFKFRNVKLIKLVCSSCDAESQPLAVPCGRVDQHVADVDAAFSRIKWAVDAEGAWCPSCKTMPR